MKKQLKKQDAEFNEILLPISRWNEYFPFPSTGAIRQIRFKNIGNFNEKVIRHIGKRLYIHVPSFFEWVETQNGQEIV